MSAMNEPNTAYIHSTVLRDTKREHIFENIHRTDGHNEDTHIKNRTKTNQRYLCSIISMFRRCNNNLSVDVVRFYIIIFLLFIFVVEFGWCRVHQCVCVYARTNVRHRCCTNRHPKYTTGICRSGILRMNFLGFYLFCFSVSDSVIIIYFYCFPFGNGCVFFFLFYLMWWLIYTLR